MGVSVPSLHRESTDSLIYIYSLVMYAPYICELGLDVARKGNREQIWQKEKSKPVFLMDHTTLWYPEAAGYAVCTIKDGMNIRKSHFVSCQVSLNKFIGNKTVLEWENGYHVYGAGNDESTLSTYFHIEQ